MFQFRCLELQNVNQFLFGQLPDHVLDLLVLVEIDLQLLIFD